eukprot:scaffold819_cov239-Pinguiococcus_pyrenoidosus.AAC.9
MLFGNAILVILRRGSLRHIRKEDPTDGALRDDGDQAVCRDAERPHGEVDHQEDHGREKLRNRREVTSTVEACRQDGDREASGALDELEVKVRSLIGLGQEGRLSDMMFHLLRDLREVLRPRAPALPCRPEEPIAPQATQRHAVPKLDKESRPEEAALRTLALSRLAPVLVVVRCGLQQVRHGIRQQVTLIFAGPGHRVSAMVLARGNLEVAPESSHPHKNLRNRELQRRLGWPKQQPRVEQRNADRIGKDHDSCVHDEAVVHGSSATKRIERIEEHTRDRRYCEEGDHQTCVVHLKPPPRRVDAGLVGKQEKHAEQRDRCHEHELVVEGEAEVHRARHTSASDPRSEAEPQHIEETDKPSEHRRPCQIKGHDRQ